MESIISTFHIDWKIIIAQMINFAIVFTVLYLYALKPLSKLMSERTEKINKGIEDARTNNEMLKMTEKEYQDMLSKARLEANKIWETSKKESESKRASMLEEAKNEVSRMIENGKKTLESEKARMVDEAKREIVSLAMEATEKIISSKKDLNNL